MSPLSSYWNYVERAYPNLKLENLSKLISEVEKTDWDEPESASELNNFAVITLIEAEKSSDISFRSLYLETAIKALSQGLENEGNPLCAAHLACIYQMIGQSQKAINTAFNGLLNILQPVYDNSKLPLGLVYLPRKSAYIATGYCQQINKLLQAKNGYTQAIILLSEVLCQSQLVFYNPSGLRFLQLASQISPDSLAANLQLGLSSLFNRQWEGLLYLQRARQITPDYAPIIQALYLAYQELKQPALMQLWHQRASNYRQQYPDIAQWTWSQLPVNSPFTYILFDESLLLAVEANLHSIVTSVLLAQGDWFEREMEFWRTQLQPGMTVIDVGANVGVYTFSAAKRVGATGKVIAVEPFSGCVRCLEETCHINQLSWVKIYAGAASERRGKAFLSIHTASELNEVIIGNITTKSGQMEEISCFTLDSLIEQENLTQLDWLKIDAEGHEMQILTGSQQLLRQFYPSIIYENIAGSKDSNTPVAEFLQSLDYQLFYYRPYLQELIPITSLEQLQGNLNIIALPPDRFD